MKNKADYLIIGNGRLGRHLSHYFSLLGINYNHWYRKSGKSLADILYNSKKVILLIPDGEIVPFIQEHDERSGIKWIHCSGALSTSLAESAHPLMTFADKLYDLETYKSISFVTETGRESFNDLFPELPNKSFRIDPEMKKYYHAWCSMAGNFTSLLWSEFFERLQTKFGIDKKAAMPYLKQITNNLMVSDNPLTGPFVRGDMSTIQKHMLTLEKDNYGEVYKAFFKAYTSGKDKQI